MVGLWWFMVVCSTSKEVSKEMRQTGSGRWDETDGMVGRASTVQYSTRVLPTR